MAIAVVPALAQPAIQPFTFPNATQGAGYGPFALTATGGSGQYAWTIATGALPANLTLSGAGSVGGAVTAASGQYTFKARATDVTTSLFDERTFMITVVPQPTLAPGAAPLPTATGNVAYNAALAAFFTITGGVAPYRFQFTSNSVTGLALNPPGTALTGVPRVGTDSYVMFFLVVDANGATSNEAGIPINVTQLALSFATTTLPSWTINRPYFNSIAAQNGMGYYNYGSAGNPPPGLRQILKSSCPAEPVIAISGTALRTTANLSGGASPYTYQQTAGNFGLGVSFSAAGVLAGTPSTTGPVAYSFTAADTNGFGVFNNCTYTFGTINPSVTPATACAQDFAQVGSYYNSGAIAVNLSGPNTFSLSGGALPGGLTLGASGDITGTPSSAPGLYSYAYQVTTSSGPVTQSCSIRLYNSPANVNAAAIVGTPSVPGTYNFSTSVTDQFSGLATQNFQVTINDVPSLGTVSPPAGTVGAAYSSSVISNARTGGTATFTFDLATGGLPPGVNLLANGQLSGTPSTAGTYNFAARVTDIAGATAIVATQIIVNNNSAALTITTSTLPVGARDQPYPANQFVSTGGVGSGYTYSLASGNLPPGVTLSSGGVLGGAPNQSGTFGFTLRVTDSASNTITRDFSIFVTDFSCPAAFAVVGDNYSSGASLSPFVATQYVISAGALPTGFNLNTSSGVITGVATNEGGFTYSITATDFAQRGVTRSCSLFAQSRIQITSPRTTARVGVPYSSAVSVNGGFNGYNFSIVAGALPSGLSLNSSTGAVTGTPAAAGANGFRVAVFDKGDNNTQRDFSIVVLSRTPAPTVRCPLPAASSDSLYRSVLSISAGGTLNFTLTAGALPGGLTLDPSNGAISGVANTYGIFNFTASVTGAAPAPVTVSCSIQVVPIPPANLNLACPDQDDLAVGEPYTSPGIASGGRLSYAYSVYQSTLPAGLSLNASTGTVFGTPTQSGAATYGLRVVDGQNVSNNTAPLCLVNIASLFPLVLSNSSLPSGTVGAVYGAGLAVSGGVPPYAFFIGTALPAGLSVNGATGVISGVPTQAGTTAFTLRVTDSVSSAVTRDLSISIAALDPLRFSGGVLDTATVGLSYASQLQGAGGSPPYRFSIISGTLAPGLTYNADGQFGGNPTTAGTYPFTVELSDTSGSRVQQLFSIAVFQGSFRLGCPNAVAELGVPYQSAANVLGGTAPLAFSIAGGALPAGLALDAATGLIAGRPTALGVSIFTFAAADGRQARTQTQCSIAVQGGALRILTEGPVLVRAGDAYSGKLDAAGGKAPYNWALAIAPVETGLQLAADGTYSGTATAKGNYSFSVVARDSVGASVSKTLQLQAADSSLTLGCPVTTTFPLGAVVSGSFAVSGGLPPYQLGLTGGNPPPSFALTGIGFSFKAVAIGGFSGQFRAIDKTGTAVQRTCQFTVTGDSLTISGSLPDGSVSVAYSAAVQSNGGVGAVRFSVAAGTLPDGLELDPASGAIAGTPLKAGPFNFTLAASDEIQRRASAPFTIRVNDASLPLTILPDSVLSDAVVGKRYSATFGAQGGKGPYLIDVTGGGSGLRVAGASLDGVPDQAGSLSIGVRARDGNNADVRKTFALRILPAGALNIVTESLPDGSLGLPYSITLAAENGTAPYLWSLVRGSLPEGFSLDSLTGVLSGAATANGQFVVTTVVADAAGITSRKSFAFEVRPEGVAPLEITSGTLPSASAGVAYNASFSARGGRQPYTWTLNGDLPPGLSFNSGGAISGTPTTVGAKNFIVTVTDSLGLKATLTVGMLVQADAVPGLSVDGLPDTGGVNQSLPFSLRIASAFGVPVSGRLTLSFVPDPIHGADDSAVRFGNGTRTIDFTIPAGSTQIPIANATVATGTLAGSVRIDIAMSFAGVTAPGPSRTVTLRRAPPVITNLRLIRGNASLELRVEGYTNTRQLSEARVSFTTAGGIDVSGATQVTVSVQAAIQNWFASAASLNFGGQFALTLPFSVAGDPANITGVSVVIVNGEGVSTVATAN